MREILIVAIHLLVTFTGWCAQVAMGRTRRLNVCYVAQRPRAASGRTESVRHPIRRDLSRTPNAE
jgi:hypothetical protein